MVDQSFAFSSGQLNQQIANAVVRRHKESALRRDEVMVLQFLQDELD